MSAGYVLLSQSSDISEQSICRGQVFQGGEDIKNTHVKTALYHWIIHHTQVFQSPIYNYLLKVYIDCHSEKNMVPKLLLHVYVQELHNIMVSPS